MSDATVAHLVPRTGMRLSAPRDCGVARVIDLPARPSGRLIEPLRVPPSARAVSVLSVPVGAPSPGPLVRALLGMTAAAHRP